MNTLTRLHALLGRLYPTAKQAHYLAINSGLNPYHVNFAGPMAEVHTSLILAAERDSKIAFVLAWIESEFPHDSELRALVSEQRAFSEKA
jgi:hypothetical protein